jgi:hypothetical protein
MKLFDSKWKRAINNFFRKEQRRNKWKKMSLKKNF